MRATWAHANIYREESYGKYPWVFSVETRLGFPIDYGNVETFDQAIQYVSETFTSFADNPSEYFN